MAQAEDLLSSDFRLWLLGQTDRQDRVGHAARMILERPCCDGADERALVWHVNEQHRRADMLALLSAISDWRHRQLGF